MAKFKNKYRIESARLSGYDYSQPGAYFVTICTKNRECIFGKIIDGKMILNDIGKIVEQCWYDLPNHYLNLILDEFIIMPNHFHCIMIINNHNINNGNIVETGLRPVSTNKTNKKHGLSEFVRALKSFSSRKINEYRNSKYPLIWQSRFYDHIIRNEYALNKIRQYIINNPLNWKSDENYTI